MTNRSKILSAMQYPTLLDKSAMTGGGDGRYTITYQFAGASRPGDLPSANNYSGWTSFTAAEKRAYKKALEHIESFLKVRFVETKGLADPDMNVAKVALPGSSNGNGGYSITYWGSKIHTWDSYTVFDNKVNLAQKGHADLMLHEIGHALGLKHPFSGASTLPGHEENNKYSVMSYSANPDTGGHGDAMMLYDIYALQDMWGSAAHKAGNTTYRGAPAGTVTTIWDTGGIDTLDARGRSRDVDLDLREGAFSSFGKRPDVAIAFGTRIERAIGGTGDDELTGNNHRNFLTGNKGNDSLFGKGGSDVLRGGSGGDRLVGNGGNDKLIGGAGRDILKGGNGSDKLNGQKGNDILVGNRGSDEFIYGGNGDRDVIVDFTNNVDEIRIVGHGNAGRVMSHARQRGDDVVFDFGDGNSLTVRDIKVGQIADDLVF